MNARLYRYVGPEDIRRHAVGQSERTYIREPGDVRLWLAYIEPIPSRRTYIPATYIVDAEQRLWVADRRSEHVACADGCSVLAAGELVFSEYRGQLEIVEVTNQSAGYCPEPECWKVLSAVLDRTGIPHPQELTVAFDFRQCDNCGATNLIKNSVFECSVCQAELSEVWNYD